VLNPALMEMAARDRIAELQRAGAERTLSSGSYRAADITASQTPHLTRHARRTDLQRAIGWFLVSVGLRLAVPRTRVGSGR
jgi:hypothetical protein